MRLYTNESGELVLDVVDEIHTVMNPSKRKTTKHLPGAHDQDTHAGDKNSFEFDKQSGEHHEFGHFVKQPVDYSNRAVGQIPTWKSPSGAAVRVDEVFTTVGKKQKMDGRSYWVTNPKTLTTYHVDYSGPDDFGFKSLVFKNPKTAGKFVSEVFGITDHGLKAEEKLKKV